MENCELVVSSGDRDHPEVHEIEEAVLYQPFRALGWKEIQRN